MADGEKDSLTSIHQWITVGGIPALLGLVGWALLAITSLQVQIASLGQHVEGSDHELANHEHRIENLEAYNNSPRR